jgi:flagellar biosynthetic protein FliR
LPNNISPPVVSPFSVAGSMAWGLQYLLGAMLALCVRIIFAAVEAMLAWFSQTATGGLLALTEEQSEYTHPALRQLAWWVAVLAFLSANGHLLIMNALIQGIAHAPPAALPSANGARQLIEGASWIVAAGLQLALPLLVFALLLQLSLAIIARTQPGVDMFSTGLALGTLGMLIALAWSMPLIAAGIQQGLVQMEPWLSWVQNQ